MTLSVVLAIVAGSVVALVLVGWWLFQQAWPTYEEKYLQSTEKTMESLLLSMPLVQIVYLSLVSLVAIFLLMFWISGNITVSVFFAIPTSGGEALFGLGYDAKSDRGGLGKLRYWRDKVVVR